MDSILAGSVCQTTDTRTWASRAAARGESKREQEFYRYYGPFRQMSDHGPTFCDVRDPQARADHQPISCPDKIMTAFCQLGALRMKARRCLIFFFDVNHAYVLAEATRTLSLEDDGTHDPGDQLWMGHSVIPRDVACCEVTVNLPSFPTKAAAPGDYRDSAFVVNDLTKHPDLKNRPYVTGYPNGRFYAGVPITAPSGTNIGAYCILDDEVRDGISEQDLVFMRDMSQTVMTHLETIRAISERQQSNQMVAGLGKFVRNAPDLEGKAPVPTNMPLNEAGAKRGSPRVVRHSIPDALIDPVMTPTATSPLGTQRDYFDKTTLGQRSHSINPPVEDVLGNSQTPVDAEGSHKARRDQLDTKKLPGLPAPMTPGDDSTHGATRPPVVQRDTPDRTSIAYQRAAEILCSSLDIDGVAFLDASVGVFGGLNESKDLAEGSTGEESAAALSQSDSGPDERRATNTKTCQILGCAQSVREGVLSTDTHPPAKKLTEVFLRNIMRRNPHGKVWSFDEHGTAHSEDAFSSDNESADGDVPPGTPNTRRRRFTRRERRSDGETLQLIFPGVRCVALHGIWDHTRHRWSVGGLYWTYDPLRVLSVETEMHFVSAFCDVIVAETRRLEVLGSDKAKSDFISSVSHELRSPLHGILGSVEILSEHEMDNTASTLIEQISSCGQSLLEIIDHLLDFANIRNQKLKKGTVKSSKIGRKGLPTTDGAPVKNELATLKMSVPLDELTEDSIVSSVYSYYYGQSAGDRTQTSVILDIDRSHSAEWRCQLATGGWKRVCMNLVTNALKYTPFGFVRVTLKQRSKPGARRRFEAVLSVTDSGIGMSKEFQKNHLFRDFSQEDTLSHGLGLGMHMVHRMVEAMGGKIDVTSDQNGTGTCVSVCVPLVDNRPLQDRRDSADKETPIAAKTLEGLEIGLVEESHMVMGTREGNLVAMASGMALASMENNCKFLGAQLTRCQLSSGKSYDLRIIMEADLTACLKLVRETKSSVGRRNFAPLLVVCNNSPNAQALRDLWLTHELNSDVVAEYIALPCGAKQIVRAIKSALRSHKELLDRAPVESGVSTPKFGDYSTPDTSSQDQAAVPPLVRPSAEQVRSGATASEPSLPVASAPEGHTHPERWPLATTTLTHRSRNRSATLQSLAQAATPESRATGPSELAPTPAASGPVLLLVDDNSINLQLLVAFAKKRKYTYLTATDGQLAVDAFENAHASSRSHNNSEKSPTGASATAQPTVILMDINMPIMDGYEATQRIRAYERKHHMAAAKIIAVTALQSEAAHTEAFGSGFDLFLSKPLKLKNLTKLIEEE